MARWIIPLIFVLLISSCSGSAKDNQEIDTLIANHFNGLAREIRESGVTSIDINSKDIKMGWNKAAVTLNVTFNVFYPQTQERRQDNDVATIYLKKSGGEWKITETKYEKTRW